MDKQKILKDLDELDNYMISNLDSQGKLKNVNDIQAKINLDYINRMETILQSEEIPDVIKSRYLSTKSAYEVASNMEAQENVQEAQSYFDYIESLRNITKNGVKSSQQALSDVAKAAQSNHYPDQKVLNAVYSYDLTPAEKRYFDLILDPMLKQIKKDIEYMELKNETALVVQNERTSLFAKIRAKLLSIFKPKNKYLATDENVNVQTNYSDNGAKWREQQKAKVEPIIQEIRRYSTH